MAASGGVTAAPDYPALFRDYIERSVRHQLEQTRAAEQITEHDRLAVQHLLSFALAVDDLWPVVRTLLWELTPKLEQAGLRAEWAPTLQSALERSQACGDRIGEGELCCQIGHLLRLQGELDSAQHWLQRGAAVFEQLGAQPRRGRALAETAYVYHLQGQVDAAGSSARSALALLPDDDPERAQVYFVLGLVAASHRRWPEAENQFQQSLDLRRRSGDRRRMAWSLQNLGLLRWQQADPQAAIGYYEEALAILENVHDPYNSAIVRMNLGLAYHDVGQLQAALRYHIQAEEIFRKLYDRLSMARVYTNIGLTYLALACPLDAEHAFQASIDRFGELQDDSARLNATDGLAMAYLVQGKYARAVDLLGTVLADLPKIVQSPDYAYLQDILTQHLQEARAGLTHYQSESEL